jgi:DNA-binding LytR/AlgR family response regulator
MSDKVKCLIIDDEPIASRIVETYCSHIPVLEIVAICSNALEAKAILQKQAIDLIFLDINMPVLDGIAFLKTLKNPPQVIFTTAYKEYAIDGFDLAAVDYLLKPFSLERFMVAVDKAIERIQKVPVPTSPATDQPKDEFIFIKADGKIYKVFFSDILFAEASGNYTKIVTEQQILLPGMSFTAIEEILPRNYFVRLHRSFIINKMKITHIEGNRVFIDKKEIPIGSNYKEGFLKLLGIQ